MKHILHKSHVASSEQLLLAFDSQPAAFTAGDQLPAAVRRVITGNDIVEYRLQRVRRRSIGFQIDERGLIVRAPRWITLREIEAAIAENQRWIRRKQIAWRHWREQHPRAEIRLADGGQVQYLGRRATLRLIAEAAATTFDGDAAQIRLSVSDQTSNAVRQALQAWLRDEARRIFTERLDRIADRIDARFAGWRLSSARTQWGSCSHNGRIRLNWRLVHFALPVIDYVIAHELAHLREPNHSPRFWKAVAQLLPGFEAARDQIKRVEIGAISF